MYLWLGLLLLAVGSVFFEFAEVSYNGIMVRITNPDNVGKVSGFGWGMGYVGGLVLLVILLVLVIQPEVGFLGASDEEGLRFRIVAVLSAVWFAIFAIPAVVSAPGAKVKRHLGRAPDPGVLRRLRGARAPADSDVVGGASDAAVLHRLGGVPGWSGCDLLVRRCARGRQLRVLRFEIIILGVAANVAAGSGAMIAGWFDDRLGPKPVIIAGLIVIILGGLPILFSAEAAVFGACALILSFCVGPVQASSRSFLARITRRNRQGRTSGSMPRRDGP